MFLTEKLTEKHKIEPDWSEFDRVIGIYKSGDNFVERGYLWFATKFYGKNNPLEERWKGLFEYEVWPWWILTKEFYDEWINPIRWWKFLSNTVAYKLDKTTRTYIVMVEYKFNNLSLSENSEPLLKFFPKNSVWGSGDTSMTSENLFYTTTSNNGSVILVAKNIEEDNIEAVADILSKNTKENIQDRYCKIVSGIFRMTRIL